ncbi:hypothetical protein N9H34_00955 [bacterium]|nr:hypothetical protein [bacterium]
MIIELNLAQAEEILENLSEIRKPSSNMSDAMSTIKRVIKHETEIQVEEIDRLIKKISDNGYKEEGLIETINKTKIELFSASTKTKDKYFDEEGNEK